MADTAVAINEFGAVALDQHLVGRPEGEVLVLANGCLCCNLGGDVEAGVMQLFARRQAGDLPPFRRLIVEPSGLADPAPLAQAILRNPLMARSLRLSGLVAVVDALFGARHLAEQPECRKQVAMADRIVITKADLAGADALRDQLAALNPPAPVLTATHGAIEPATLFTPDFLDPDLPSSAELPRARRFAESVTHPDQTEAVVLTHAAPLDWSRFESWLRGIRLTYADALLRLKGLVALQDSDQPLLLQGIHHVLHPPILLEAWPDTDHTTRLVLILRGIDPAPIRSAWAEFTRKQEVFF
jgi:G3E family GTPase